MRQPIRVFIITFETTVMCMSITALIFSKSLLGYYYTPPELDRKIFSFEKIVSVTPITTVEQADNSFSFAIDRSKSIDQLVKTDREICKTSDNNSCLDLRIIFALDNKGKLPLSTKLISKAILDSLYIHLKKNDLLEIDEGKLLSGVVVEAKDRDNKHYLFVALRGKCCHNDVYPFYEFLFFLQSKESSPILLSAKHFRVDVTGIGWVVGLPIFMFFTVIGMVVSLFTTITFIILSTKNNRN